MPSNACQRVIDLRQQYHLTDPVDLDPILDGEQLTLVSYDFGPVLMECIYDRYIGISPRVTDPRERRVLVAHAIAHHCLHAGNHLFLATLDPIWLSQHEHQAEHFALHLLMPGESLIAFLITQHPNLAEVAEYYRVPEPFAARRFAHLAEDTARMQARAG